MAKPNWINTSALSGTGNATVMVTTGGYHTGRMPRNATITFKASGVSDVPVSVVQSGKPEFVTLKAPFNINKEGGSLTITGKSNSRQLTFSLGSGDILLSLPSNYTVNGFVTSVNGAIGGDPGAVAEYDFAITISDIPVNDATHKKNRTVVVKTENGNSDSVIIEQVSTDGYLRVDPTSVELLWTGDPKQINVTSNENWVIE